MEAPIASYGDSSSDSDSESPASSPSPSSELNNPQESTPALSVLPLPLLDSSNSFGNLLCRLSSLSWAWASSPESHSSSPVRLTAGTEHPWLLRRVFGCETLSQSLNSLSFLSFICFCSAFSYSSPIKVGNYRPRRRLILTSS